MKKYVTAFRETGKVALELPLTRGPGERNEAERNALNDAVRDHVEQLLSSKVTSAPLHAPSDT